MSKGTSWIDPPSGIANVPLSPELMLRVARGFLLLFWSLAITALLARGVVQIPLTRTIQLPSYVIGLCIAYVGALFLRRGGGLTPRWMQRVRDAMALILVQVYLSPFPRWWTCSPQSGYYLANMLAIVVITALLFYTMNMLAAEWARVVHNNDFRIECELSAWLSMITAVFPAVTILADSVFSFSASNDGVSQVLNGWVTARWLRWLDLVQPFPLILTALVLWKARSLALRRCTSGAVRIVNKPSS